jgi:type III pantothenate kinase
MNRLLLDLGNTRLKWASAGSGSLERRGAIALDAPDFDLQAEHAWSGLPAPASIWLSAVAGDAAVARATAAIVARWRDVSLHRVASPASAAGVRSAYDEPERLGVDRFLAMVGARRHDPGPVLVAGCGTALAIDLLDADGHHRGGLIAPAPSLMRAAVLERTGRVAWQRPGRVFAFGRSTEDGLESGCWHAAAALVERAVAQACRELGATPGLLLHGGDAERLAALLDTPARIAPDLVLEGLLRYAESGGGPG